MKTRFAPSPTGYIHIGNVRSAIYPYLLAKQQQGKFILRIEDTDQARFVDGATELIEETLRWLGLDWDEGVEVGGPSEPYFQSERRAIYETWAKKLIASGRAYADPTDTATIQGYRDECNAKKIPYLYRNFRPENPPEWQIGMPLRFKSEPKPRQWHDAVMGDLEAGPEVQDDIILIKKDGLPTYNFAHIVDDSEMGITHIIRGVEYLSSMPNYLALYEALGLEPPVFVSLPHILGPNGTKKLSKRDNAKSVTEYRADGILPEAMLNYLACLGWNDGTEQEIYSHDELVEKFSLDRIQNSGARFDENKLLWVNGQWIRKIFDEQGCDALYTKTTEKFTTKIPNADGELVDVAVDFWGPAANEASDDCKKQVLAIIYDRLKTLKDLAEMTKYFFLEPEIELSQITENKFIKKITRSEQISLLEQAYQKLSASNWTESELQTALNELLAETEQKPALLFSIIRIAVSFAPFSPALHLTLNVLGKDRSLNRLQKVIDALKQQI